jgi:hypothetical protein
MHPDPEQEWEQTFVSGGALQAVVDERNSSLFVGRW